MTRADERCPPDGAPQAPPKTFLFPETSHLPPCHRRSLTAIHIPVTSSSPTCQLVGGDANHKLCDGDLHCLPPALLALLMRQRRETPGGP